MYGRAYSALRFTPGLLSDKFNMLIPAECIRSNLKHRHGFALRIYQTRRSIQRHVVILLGQVILASNCRETDILTVKSGGIPWRLQLVRLERPGPQARSRRTPSR